MIETHIATALELTKAQYPKPMTGLIVEGKFKPLDTPEDLFSPGLVALKETAEAVIITRDKFMLFPDRVEMAERPSWRCPWIYAAYDPRIEVKPVIWEASHEPQPILDRKFIPGIADCYTLIKDTFTLGRDALREQGIDWPFLPYKLNEYPRDNYWWTAEDDFYIAGMKEQGFVEIDSQDARAGDVFLFSICTEHLNHGGMLLDDGNFLHHLPNRLSRIEPPGKWEDRIKVWLRCENAKI